MCIYVSLLNEKMAITTYANTKDSDQPANLHNVIRECACLSESLRFATVTRESCISRYLLTDRGDRGCLIGQYHYFGEMPESYINMQMKLVSENLLTLTNYNTRNIHEKLFDWTSLTIN